MKTVILIFAFITTSVICFAQITSASIKLNFGIDADVRANYYKSATLPGNDDWFSLALPGNGVNVIDTTGAASIVVGYLANPALRNIPIIRRMSYPPFSVVNNSLLMDAVYVRDFHGNDSTVYASGSNKNGMSPIDWSSPPSQSVPDKNEILDVFVHVRREGNTAADSLWMFCGISIENTTGNRYFDFEMYQSDIFYNSSLHQFTGYGPDAGHTSWEFDPSGNVIKPGDIILTSEYGSGGLTLIEARIWINKNSLLITPTAFSWAGQFDGASNSSQFGYASIIPNTTGPFYTGLQSSNLVWAGPFGLVLGDGSYTTVYRPRQFMEFAVNLSKLGLDPVKLLGGSTCDRPFQKVMAKTRASTSFTSELKDFVAPFKIFEPAKVDLFTDVPIFCGFISTSNIKVTNPVNNSTYSWTTLDGHFADTSDKTSVFVDMPGTYIVTQKLNSDCPIFSRDTIVIPYDADCGILLINSLSFSGKLSQNNVRLSWNDIKSEKVDNYSVERSVDGIHFYPVQKVYSKAGRQTSGVLFSTDNIENVVGSFAYYRLKIYNSAGQYKYSNLIKIDLSSSEGRNRINIAPNPVKETLNINIFCKSSNLAHVMLIDNFGRAIQTLNVPVGKGNNVLRLDNFHQYASGVYTLKATVGVDIFTKRILVTR